MSLRPARPSRRAVPAGSPIHRSYSRAHPTRGAPARGALGLALAIAGLPALLSCGEFDNTRDDGPEQSQPRLPLTDDGRIDALERRVAELEAWRKKVEATIRDLGTNGDAQADVTGVMINLRTRVDAIEARLAALQGADVSANSAVVVELRARLAALSTDLDAARASLAALSESDTRMATRLDALDAWRASTAELLARLEALDIPGALAGIDAWRKSVDASLADVGTWRTEHTARVQALEALSNATAACVARLDLAAPEGPTPSDAERVCAEVRARLLALSTLPGVTASLEASLADLGNRVGELERITSARLARLRELEIALFLERYRSQKVLAPCGDDAGLSLTLTLTRVTTSDTVVRKNGTNATGRLSDGEYTFPAGGAACAFTVDTVSRKLLGWQREALKLPPGRTTLQVKELCSTAAGVTTCDSVFERREVR